MVVINKRQVSDIHKTSPGVITEEGVIISRVQTEPEGELGPEEENYFAGTSSSYLAGGEKKGGKISISKSLMASERLKSEETISEREVVAGDSEEGEIDLINKRTAEINHVVNAGKWKIAADLAAKFSNYLMLASERWEEKDTSFAQTLKLSHSYWNLASNNYKFLAEKRRR